MDAAGLDAAVDKLKQGGFQAIDSLLVVRKGALVLEYYANPEYYGREYQHRMRSVSKSVTAMVVGLVIEQNLIPGVDVPVRGLIAEFFEGTVDDPRKDELTLEQVLTMTAGFEWDEWIAPYGDPKNDFDRMALSSDWIGYVFDKPLVNSPGSRFEYNSGYTLMLGAVVQQATGQTVEDFARENLFDPLGIEGWSWPLAHAGMTNTPTGLGMRRIDLARIGQFMLRDGRWENRQILSREWIGQMTDVKIRGSGVYDGLAYGYQWWRFADGNPLTRGLTRNDVYFAYGYEGQLLLVVPHLELVVVSTAGLFGDAWVLQFELIRDYIYPAVTD
jgi:CubicO group peptidase (beta-lactamase class C family)